MILDHDLGPACRPRRTEDARKVLSRIALGQFVRTMSARQSGKTLILRIAGIGFGPAAKAQPRRCRSTSKRVDVEVLVVQNERWVHHRSKVCQDFRVDFDIERAHHRAETPHAEPQQ